MNVSTKIWALTPALIALLLLSACATVAAPPPAVSAAPYARTAPADNATHSGSVLASAGYLATLDGAQSVIGQGGAVFYLSDAYDLTLLTRGDVTTAEGNLRLRRGLFEIGWTHGLGAGLIADTGNAFYTYHATTGLTFQVGTQSPTQFFGALRVAWADGTGPFHSAWYVLGSLGFRLPVTGSLGLNPELQVASNSDGDLLLAPTLTFSAGF